MKNFVNIDSLEELKKIKFTLKKGMLIAGLTSGIAGAALSMTGYGKDEVPFEIAKESEQDIDSVQVYMSYMIKPGDTLTSIAEYAIKTYPETANFYTVENLIDEIARLNGMKYNKNNIISGNYLIVPYYLPKQILEEKEEFYTEQKEAAAELEDYEEYLVEYGDSYWKIACMYTDDNNEIVRLVRQIQDLNNDITLKKGDVITIPNIEKYKLLHKEYSKSR